MKRLSPILTICIVLLSITVFAQQEQKPSTEESEEAKVDTVEHVKKNELKLNLFSAVISTLDISYERVLKDNSSVGLTAAYCFHSDEFDRATSEFIWSFNPYYRLYFGKKSSSGFFVETNGAIAQTRKAKKSSYFDDVTNDFIEKTTYYDNFGYGAGFSVGAKFLTTKGLVGEIFGGIGRYFNKKESNMPKVYPRLGVLIGKRF